MKDHAGEEIMRGQIPMIAGDVAGRIAQHVRDVLRVFDRLSAKADFGERVVPCCCAISARRIESQAEVAKAFLSPARRDFPVLAFDVVDHDAVGPTEQGRDYQSYAFACTRRCEREYVRWCRIAEIIGLPSISPCANIDAALCVQQPGSADLLPGGPVS